ncbi:MULTISPECIES: hypothetical protein [Sphingobacteriaceae]|uniref:Uncharacterized protein n=1 Tax=Sphingobacterium sp. (strain 21) TaxID=743722 RepID=F4C5W6_SPHS2
MIFTGYKKVVDYYCKKSNETKAMEAIVDYYKTVLDTGTKLLLLNLIVLVLSVFFLTVKKTPFSFGFILIIVLFSFLFAGIGIGFYKDALKKVSQETKETIRYDMEIRKAEVFRKESRTRVVIEMCVVVLALFLLLRAKPESEKQGVAIALILCGALMFVFDIYVSSRLTDHIADLKILKHNSTINEK